LGRPRRLAKSGFAESRQQKRNFSDSGAPDVKCSPTKEVARVLRPKLFSMDKRREPALHFGMAQPEEKHVTPVSLVVDLILVGLFFAYMFTVLRTHVMSTDPKMVTIWGLITTSCLTGVFWLALQMFRVVFRAHRASKK
jgi:hypothetical protein